MKIYTYQSKITWVDTLAGLIKALKHLIKFILVIAILTFIAIQIIRIASDRANHKCLVSASDKRTCE